MSIHCNRAKQIRRILADASQALLITNEANVFYFSGFQKSEGYFLITKDESYLLVDFRYYEAAKNKAKDCEVICASKFNDSVLKILKEHNVDSLVLETENITLSKFFHLEKFFTQNNIALDTSGLIDKAIENLRIIKTDDELKFIDEAQKITEKAYIEVLNYLKPGVCENQIANELEYLIKKFGGEEISFDLITITGKKTSLPHGVPDDTQVKEGDFFTFDIGAIYNGYHSDMTRTVAVKSYTDEMEKVYSIVLDAHNKALTSVSSGLKASEIDKIARDIISNAGYGDCFGHSAGHGVGLDIHEAPAVSPSGETILSENMVITIEPGIYIEDKFGVRIEDMIYVTKDSFKSFANIPKQLIVV